MPKVVDPTEVKAKQVTVRTLPEARALFCKATSVRIIFGAIVVTLALRIALGDWSWRDAAMVGIVLAISPFTEWLIHRFFLHLKPVPWKGKRVEISAARRHRHHHQSPGLLREVLLKPVEISAFIPMIAISMLVIARPLYLISGGLFVPIWLTTTLTSYLLLALYEWTHLLIHTQYKPQGKIYGSCYKSHRLHHFRNEYYWLGVTTNLADRVLRTNPRKDEVPVSPTATNLAA